MAYAERAYTEWTDIHNVTHRLSAYKDGYGGSADEYVGQENPMTLPFRGANISIDDPLFISQVQWHFWIASAAEYALITDIIASQEGEYYLEYRRGGSLMWRGILLSDMGEIVGDAYPRQCTLQAVDGLSFLKGMDYTDPIDLSSGFRQTVQTVIEDQLEALGFGFGVIYGDTWNFSPGTGNIIRGLEVDIRQFVNFTDRTQDNQYLSRYDVLKILCTRFNLRIVQWEEHWHLIQADSYQHASPNFQDEASSSISDPYSSFTVDSADVYWDETVRSNIPLLKSAQLRYDHQNNNLGLYIPPFDNTEGAQSSTLSEISTDGTETVHIEMETLSVDTETVTLTIQYGSNWWSGGSWLGTPQTVTYSVSGHRTIPEITDTLPALDEEDLTVTLEMTTNNNGGFIDIEVIVESSDEANSAARITEAVTDQAASDTLTLPDVTIGDGPVDFARGQLRTTAGDVVTNWSRINDAGAQSIDRQLLEYHMAYRGANRAKKTWVIRDYFPPHALLVYDSTNYLPVSLEYYGDGLIKVTAVVLGYTENTITHTTWREGSESSSGTSGIGGSSGSADSLTLNDPLYSNSGALDLRLNDPLYVNTDTLDLRLDATFLEVNGSNELSLTLTDAEYSQLQNINSVTITNTQWGYLGSLDQALATTDNVAFNELNIGGNWTFLSETDAGVERLTLKAVGANAAAELFLHPTGTANASRITISPDNNDTNYSGITLESNGTVQIMDSIAEGTESLLPVEFRMDGTAAITIDTDGGVGINKTSVTAGYALDVSGKLQLSHDLAHTDQIALENPTYSGDVKAYIGNYSNGLYIAKNAYYDGSWNYDSASKEQGLIHIDASGNLKYRTKAAGSTNPDEVFQVARGGDVYLQDGAFLGVNSGVGITYNETAGQFEFSNDNVLFGTTTQTHTGVTLGDGLDIGAENWSDGVTDWRITSEGVMDMRSIFADSLHIEALIADIDLSLLSGRVISKSVTQVSRDFTVPATSSSATLYVEDLPGGANSQAFAANDYIRLQVIDRSGGGLVWGEVWGQVTSYTDLSGGEQSWTFTTTEDNGFNGDTVYAGAAATDYGQSGDGYIEMDARESDAPWIRMKHWTTDPSVGGNHTIDMQLDPDATFFNNSGDYLGLVAENPHADVGSIPAFFAGATAKTGEGSAISFGTDGKIRGTGIYIRDSLEYLIEASRIFGDGDDGNVTISSNTSLTRDMYYNDLTVNDGVTLDSNGYRIFAFGTATINGIISNEGTAGSNGSNGADGIGGSGGSGGAGGTAPGEGTLKGGKAGGSGGDGADGDGSPGVNGNSATGEDNCINANDGADGGAGGGTVLDRGSAGGGATATQAETRMEHVDPHILTTMRNLYSLDSNAAPIGASAGSGGGGGGASDSGSERAGGGGGGAGASGGNVMLSAKFISMGTNGRIYARGKDGGDGGDGGDNHLAVVTFGGGGGGGGNGGLITVITGSDLDEVPLAKLSVAAGSGGTAGDSNPGTDEEAENGSNGTAGTIIRTRI